MARKRDKTRPPNTPEIYREFLRDLMLSDPVKAHLAQAVVTDDKVLLAAMRLAAGEIEAKSDASGQSLPDYVNVQILEQIALMTTEQLQEYAQTGRLDPRIWRPELRERNVTPPLAAPPNGTKEGQ